jgi:hypothetical protein
MKKISGLFTGLKQMLKNITQNSQFLSTTTLKSFGTVFILFLSYIFGYLATWIFDVLFFIYAMVISLKCLYYNSGRSNTDTKISYTPSLNLWIAYGTITTVTYFLSLLQNYIGWSFLSYPIDFVKVYLYFCLVSNRITTEFISNCMMTLYQTNRMGIDYSVMMWSTVVNHVAYSMKNVYDMTKNKLCTRGVKQDQFSENKDNMDVNDGIKQE